MLLRTAQCLLFFFFNDTATTEIYTLSLHDALPILDDCSTDGTGDVARALGVVVVRPPTNTGSKAGAQNFGLRYVRSEEHTSELQSRLHLVCRLLLEKKKKKTPQPAHP